MGVYEPTGGPVFLSDPHCPFIISLLQLFVALEKAKITEIQDRFMPVSTRLG